MNPIERALIDSQASVDEEILDELEYDSIARQAEVMVASTEAFHSALRSSENMIERIENICATIDYDPRPSDAGRVLIDEGLQAALGDSSTTVHDLIPNLHEEGSVISTESVRSTIGNALSRILSYISRMLADMASLWNNLMSMSKWVRLTANNGLNRVKTNKGLSPSQPTFEFKGDPNRLMINGAIYKSNASLLANLVELRRQLEYFVGGYSDLVGKIGDSYLSAIKSGDSPEKTLATCVEATRQMNYSTISGFIRARNQSDQRFDGGTVDGGPALLGNRSVFIPKEVPPLPHASLLGQAQEVRKRNIALLHTNEVVGQASQHAALPVMSTSEAEGILKEIVKISTIIDNFDSRKRNALTKKIRAITDAYKVMCEAANKAGYTNEDRALHNSVGRFVTQYSSMVSSPTDSLIVHALSCCRMVVGIANRSMQYYR